MIRFRVPMSSPFSFWLSNGEYCERKIVPSDSSLFNDFIYDVVYSSWYPLFMTYLWSPPHDSGMSPTGSFPECLFHSHSFQSFLHSFTLHSTDYPSQGSFPFPFLFPGPRPRTPGLRTGLSILHVRILYFSLSLVLGISVSRLLR